MSRLSNEQVLSNIYYDLERGYGSAKSLYEQAKEEGAAITLEEGKNFMKKQPNKQIKGYQNYNSYLVPFARAEFQIEHFVPWEKALFNFHAKSALRLKAKRP